MTDSTLHERLMGAHPKGKERIEQVRKLEAAGIVVVGGGLSQDGWTIVVEAGRDAEMTIRDVEEVDRLVAKKQAKPGNP